ncbi:uncharacterized protein LOC118195356 [Stegodyphus dumicola]|uniref:uncharacterized protein LOC118195356 n=1 Tax=Stegodyphus dumicola TaxID=202533 RepID=UPI0015AC03E4|nr:uncharacterized protein LOC118195356 [Stegodyphus dumicola]
MRPLALTLLCGFLSLISGEDCIPEILKCSPLRVSLSTYKDLAETEDDLHEICNAQLAFIQCVTQAAETCNRELSTALELSVINNRVFLQELCVPRSSWWRRYLDNSPCINRQNFSSCFASDSIGSLGNTQQLPLRCTVRDEVTTCISNITLENCDGLAAVIFMRLLALATDDDFICSTIGDQSKLNTYYETQGAENMAVAGYFSQNRLGLVAQFDLNTESSATELPLKNLDLKDIEDSDSPVFYGPVPGKITDEDIDNFLHIEHHVSEETKTFSECIGDDETQCEAYLPDLAALPNLDVVVS